jgi:hypothetical protein
MEYIQIPEPDFSFNEIAILKAEQLFGRVFCGPLGYQFDAGYKETEFEYSVSSSIGQLYNREDKIACILEILKFLNEQANADGLTEGIKRKKYLVYTLASKLVDYNFDRAAFSNEEVSDLERKINAILIKLDEIQVGNEILFDEINELKADLDSLKTDVPLGKKRWYQRATGIVATFACHKGSDVIFDETLKPLLKDLIHYHQIIDKLLK